MERGVRQRQRASVRALLPTADAVALIAAAVLSSWWISVTPSVGGDPSAERLLAVLSLPLWLGAMSAAGAYRTAYFNAGSDALRRFLLGTVGGVLALTSLGFVLNLPISRAFVALLAAVALVLGLLARLGFRSLLLRSYRSERLVERTLVVGHDAYAVDLVRLMSDGSGIPYRAVGLCWIDGAGWDCPTDLEVPVVEALDDRGRVDLRDVCGRLGVDVVVVAAGGLAPEDMRQLFVSLEGAPQEVIVAPSLFPLLPWRMTVETITGLPLVHVSEVRLAGWRAAVKRTVDLVGGGVLLVTLGPVLLVAMLAVLVADGRPVLFRQERIGRDGRPFRLVKVRTMVRDAETQLDALRVRNEVGGHFFKLTDDPRVTRVGRVLRAWSIDEIPQLLSVMRGDMSLVGPRPLFSQPEEYDDLERRRLRIRPGITGPWQVSGRSTVSGAKAIQQDLFYLENWTLLGDIVLLARTVTTVLSRRGAA